MPWITEPITTQRLRLRAATESDKPVIAKLLKDPEARMYLGGPASEEELSAFMESTVGEQFGSFVIADGAMDICMGTVRFSDQRGEWELSYDLMPRYWGRSFAFEAVTAAIEWAWGEPAQIDAESVIAVTQRGNATSIALLERLGFEYERKFTEFDETQMQYRLHNLG